MAGAAEQRRADVLRAVVADYIASQEPVGSKALLERHNLKVSSATIRNDMAVLEAEGYITQQHASSGRIPTEKGYRAFVDTLHDIKPLSAAEKRAIISFLEDGVDLEDVLRRSVQLLAQLTNQAAVIQVPTLSSSRVRHCEVVALSPLRLLLVVITDTGRVDQRNVELDETIEPDHVVQLKEMLNRALVGKAMVKASAELEALAENAPPEISSHVSAATTVLIETLVEQPSDRIIMAGASNLTRGSRAFPAGFAEVIEALEEQVIILKLMADLPDLGDVQVVIGEENHNEQLHSTSVVTTSYGSLDDGPLGGLSVVGPTYMDYPGTISKASAVARYVSRILAND